MAHKQTGLVTKGQNVKSHEKSLVFISDYKPLCLQQSSKLYFGTWCIMLLFVHATIVLLHYKDKINISY